PRERQKFQTRERYSRAGGDRRVRRHPRLLRADLDDPRRVPHAGAGGRGGAIRREITFDQATRPIEPEAAASVSAAAGAGGRALPARRQSKSRKRCRGIGGAISTPWPKSQPMTIRACISAAVSIPSATAALPKRWARSIAVWQMAALVASIAQSRTKLVSSLS